MHLLHATQYNDFQFLFAIGQGIIDIRRVLDLLLVDVRHNVARLQAATKERKNKELLREREGKGVTSELTCAPVNPQ